MHLVKSNIPIPTCSDFRYFEVEVVENKLDSNIYIGLVEAQSPFANKISAFDQISADDTLLIHGGEGFFCFGNFNKAKKIQKALTMKELGDCVGVCLHFQSVDDQANELVEKQFANSNSSPNKDPKKEKDEKARIDKKKEEMRKIIRKEKNLKDQTRVLIFKDGICVSSVEPDDADKMKLTSKILNS